MARLVSMAVFIFIVFALLLIIFVENNTDAYMAILLLGLAFILFVFTLHKGAKRMQKELSTINTYLKNLENIDKIDYKTHFFTQEFEEINQNLMKVLKKSKKREDDKQRYNAKLKLKNRQRADMLSAIAHEFRNPISSIVGYAQTLQDDAQIPAQLQTKFLDKIYNNGHKIEALLARLILWNKFESGEATLEKSEFDIYALVEEVKFSLEEIYKDRSIEIRGKKRRVKADKTLMEVLLKNLIENALKYSKETVSIEIDDTHVLVRDEGIGIDSKELDKVSKKFYRSNTQNWDNSMGLGLSIVKTILSLHHAKLEIKSKIGEGSTFSFKI
jgi:signal transduction histidine kinase